MADAIPTKDAPTTASSTAIIPKPLSQWEAMKQAGWWATHDTVMVVLIAMTWVTGAYWKLFGSPDVLCLIALLLVTIILLLVWAITAIFRCALFVLRVHADISTLPQDAARIAVAYLAGTK